MVRPADLLLEVTAERAAPTGRVTLEVTGRLGGHRGGGARRPATRRGDDRDAGARPRSRSAAPTAGSPSGTATTRHVDDDSPLHADHTSRDDSWVTLTVDPTTAWTLRTTTAGASDPGASSVADPTARRAGAVLGHHRPLAVAARSRRPGRPGRAARTDQQRPAVVRPRRPGPLPVAARPRAVHRRRLGHPRRQPGSGRPAARPRTGTTALRDVLLRLLRAQNARGDWPQAFDFLAATASRASRTPTATSSTGRCSPLGDYLLATGDATLLDDEVPFVGDGGPPRRRGRSTTSTAPSAIEERTHPREPAARVRARRLERLAAAGRPGTWRRTSCSTWTVVLQAQALAPWPTGCEPSARRAPTLADRAAAGSPDARTRRTRSRRASCSSTGSCPGYGLATAPTAGRRAARPPARRRAPGSPTASCR